SRCKKKLFGLINCCKKGGGGIGALFSNNQIMSNAADTVINAIGSTYTYDALLAADAPSFILNGFESLFSTGASSALAGMLAGELTVTQFLTTLVPGPWTIAILIIQYSGLLSCPESDKVTAMKRDANLCVTVGSYCSTKLSIIRSCVEQTTKFCCYNSRLAKLINAAGRQQLGRSFGSAQSPDCDGFSMADFQRLDFAKMDLSEFYSDIVPKTPNVGAYTERVRATSQSCYYGNGKCGP
ncbi:MAG: conjugal transfer protein TraN, partial [Betaproteobacteria bacterium]|nr:conjugal transfer protein TraN [Betaproteobacteria bacterium]